MNQCLKALAALEWGPRLYFQHLHDNSQTCINASLEDLIFFPASVNIRYMYDAHKYT